MSADGTEKGHTTATNWVSAQARHQARAPTRPAGSRGWMGSSAIHLPSLDARQSDQHFGASKDAISRASMVLPDCPTDQCSRTLQHNEPREREQRVRFGFVLLPLSLLADCSCPPASPSLPSSSSTTHTTAAHATVSTQPVHCAPTVRSVTSGTQGPRTYVHQGTLRVCLRSLTGPLSSHYLT